MAKIPFNIPPYIGTELTYVKQAIDAHKICGDGQFTKKCHAYLEERFNAQKVLLTIRLKNLFPCKLQAKPRPFA